MASVQVTETDVSIEATITRADGVARVTVVTQSRTNQPALPYGRQAQDTLLAPGIDLMPSNIKQGLATFLDWVEAQAKTRWNIP